MPGRKLKCGRKVEYENGLAVRFIPLPPEHEAAYRAAVREVIRLLKPIMDQHTQKIAQTDGVSKEWPKTG